MLESGICKLASGDATWRSLTAMQYHFHTQPLPNPLAWFADKLPAWLQAVNVLMTFLFELIFPFFIFFGRPGRLIAVAGFISLQLAIALTGNYAYFNFLTLALCLFLIDDGVWSKFLAVWSGKFDSAGTREADRTLKSTTFHLPPARAMSKPAKIVAMVSALSIWSLSLAEFSSNSGLLPLTMDEWLMKITKYRLVNNYGLFATMTTTRDEIEIEGSADGNLWIAYDFRFKPQDLNATPCIVAPCQPRLDWQMWFAALGSVEQSPWFAHLLLKLFQNSPHVLQLFKHNPFPNHPPNFLRAKLYRYTFSDWETLLKKGEWWHRKYSGDFIPAISAKEISEKGNSQ
jgi:hypothetical protein